MERELETVNNWRFVKKRSLSTLQPPIYYRLQSLRIKAGRHHAGGENKMDNITASEIAGLGVGALLLGVTIAAPKLDSFISASQRSTLDMCKRCGNLRMTACSNCKGVGSVKQGGAFSFNFMDDAYQSLGGAAESNVKYIPCTKCQAKGRFSCPDCSKTL